MKICKISYTSISFHIRKKKIRFLIEATWNHTTKDLRLIPESSDQRQAVIAASRENAASTPDGDTLERKAPLSIHLNS